MNNKILEYNNLITEIYNTDLPPVALDELIFSIYKDFPDMELNSNMMRLLDKFLDTDYANTTSTFIDDIETFLELEKKDGYYIDAYNKRVSYDNIPTLKNSDTQLNLSLGHKCEIYKSHNSYKYFRANYCKIITKAGIGRPEPREYQIQAEDMMLTGEDGLLFFSRQSGKCIIRDTYISIKKGNVKMKLTAESVHNIKEIEKYSDNEPKKKHNFMTIEKLLNTKLFEDVTLSKIQEERITELFEVVNNLSFNYSPIWIKNFILDGVEDNYILRIIKIHEYNREATHTEEVL